ncbi:uncharacterized protein PHALS_10403 [Plasmopara halstedii]|uniref:Uncharacterized protein n=1 Tax=Plasmopara halstedii TaxID=4781 RepID=A0A0P1AHI1_PLAHL|nr:uncharacterized protein PHALS_10403 [Plasmopara halstedii]CEG40191.1 hypothetical protein PHALS_10403 [Plasmopara halstedii]|eukprot:XP_024576560.1 hypothetical protein PHALS_10403 [Plasmopara halstedii]
MAHTAPSRTRASMAPLVSNAGRKRRHIPQDSSSSDEEQILVRDTRRRRGKRQQASAILDEFTSLDALLSNDLAEKNKRENRERRMRLLREESETMDKDAPIGKIISSMDSNMSTLSGDNYLFAPPEIIVSEEKFGYVFTPITEPLPYRTYRATESELKSDLNLIYKTMQSTDSTELSGLVWSKSILIRCMLKHQKEMTSQASATSPIVVPPKIGSWLFLTMSFHSCGHVVGGCFSNLLLIHSSGQNMPFTKLISALPVACFAHTIESFWPKFGDNPSFQMEWKPTIYDFLNAFRAYGFQDSKRSMSVKSKIPVTPPATNLHLFPFPTVNMQYVLTYLVLCLRTMTLTLEGYDAFSFTMFFLRMQFESTIHASIVELATVCIEELLDVFPRTEWRTEWAPQLVLRIAGSNEGLFDSAAGWLAVARRLPRTLRGTQLTTGLAVYVLQHRIDKVPLEGAKSENPLKLPIQSGLVVDIVAGIVEDMTQKYVETRKSIKDLKKSPPFDLLCKKVALMDLALQAFLNILTPNEMNIMLGKLDRLADAHKSTMSSKWHELKTLVSLMHRKYSLENLRIGRHRILSPSAKTVLSFGNDE